MKSILYSGGMVLTGDVVADAVIEYASELARHESSDTLEIPSITATGETAHTQLLLGPASQFVVEETESAFDDPTDDALVESIREKTGKLLAPKPVASKDTVDYPEIDDETVVPDPPLADA